MPFSNPQQLNPLTACSRFPTHGPTTRTAGHSPRQKHGLVMLGHAILELCRLPEQLQSLVRVPGEAVTVPVEKGQLRQAVSLSLGRGGDNQLAPPLLG